MKRTRAWTVMAAVAFGGLASGVGFAQAPADGMSSCASLADEKARLKCYDEQMARQGHSRLAPVAGASQGAAAPDTVPEDFGLEGKALRRKQASEPAEAGKSQQLVARVSEVSTRPRGELLITLDNGQVWTETLRTGGLAPNVGDEVTIKRGKLGSYYLHPQKGLALRVRRVK